MHTKAQAFSQAKVQNNLLLGCLDTDVFQRLAPRLELMTMTRGETVCEPGSKLSHAYFPVSCVISLSQTLEDGASGESTVIGNEGMLGVAIFTGGYTMTNEAAVKIEGQAYRVPAEVLMDEFNRSSSTRNYLLKYSLALFTQASQTAICNRHHSVVQRLCRRLLLILDRIPDNEVHLTQERIAIDLGVRRESISEAAGYLQEAGLIAYKRGRIIVLDRDLLEDYACECYQVVKEECERLESFTAPQSKHLPYSTERRRRIRPAPATVTDIPRH